MRSLPKNTKPNTKPNTELNVGVTGGKGWLNPVTTLLVLLLILVGCLPFVAAVTLYSLYSREVMREAELNASKTAALLLQSFEQSVDPIDALLKNFARDFNPRWTPQQTYEALQRFALPPTIVQLAVVDRTGVMVASNLAPPDGTRLDLSDREHVRVHMTRNEPTGDLFISKPVLGRVSKVWTLQLTRPLGDGEGHFAGVVVASYSIADFINFYKGLRIEDDMLIALVGVDGIVRARAARETSFGHDVSKSAAFQAALQNRHIAYDFKSSIDQVDRVGYVIQSQRYPILVAVAYSRAFVEEHTRDFRAAIVGTAVALGAALFILVLLAGRYMSMQRRLNARELEALARQREADVLGAISRVPGVSVMHVDDDGPSEVGVASPGPLSRVMRRFLSSGRFRAVSAGLKAPLVRNEHLADGGDELEVEMVVTPLKTIETEPGGSSRREVVVFAVDQTSRRMEENKLYQMSKLASLGEVATGLAHEINQPLGVIRLAAANARTGLGRGLPAEHFVSKLERILQQTERMSRIIDHMRIFGRKSDEELQPCRPEDAVEGALQVVGEQVRLDQIDVRTHYAGELPLVLCRQDQLEQVLINLLQNARDAIAERRRAQGESFPGRIRIDVEREDAGPAPMVRFDVADNAGGIPEAIRDRIFQPFFTTKPPGKGTGLGLSVSFGIIRDHGGSFSVTNGRQGAIFSIRLPARRIEPEPVATAGALPANPSQTQTGA